MLLKGRQREDNLRAPRLAEAGVGASAPTRLDDVAQDAGPLRGQVKCPLCGVPMLLDGLCMNCWDIC